MPKKKIPSALEVLAPAGSIDALVAAVRCGADAVYLGQKNFSARKNSQNFDEETLAQAVSYAHRCGVKIHQALNIVVFDQELSALKECIRTAVYAGVDAMIVQDWGVAELVKRFAPDMPIHASTQMAIHSPAGVKLAEELGFSRVVLARELTREEILKIVQSTSLETEIFVHGAHCMSVSGQCYLSAAIGGKSGNRGQCAQPCRLPFTSGTENHLKGKKLCSVGENVLSLKDMDIIPHLREIEEMGVTSVKIEGRMKRPEYVAAAVTACRQALDGETPDIDTLRAVFSRSGFTDGYYTGHRDKKMFGFRTKEDVTAAGDVFNRLKGLYHKENPVVPVYMDVSLEPDTPSKLTISDGVHTVLAEGEKPFAVSENSRPADVPYIARSVEKLGGTPYYLEENGLSVHLSDGLMMKASSLNALRREAVEKLDAEREKVTGRFVECPMPEFPTRIGKTMNKPEVWVKVREQSQLTAKLISDTQKIILPAGMLLELTESGSVLLEKMRNKVLPVLPRLTYTEGGCCEILKKLKNAGYSSLYCESGAHIILGKKEGFTLFGGPYLNFTNSAALQRAEQIGLFGTVLSPEGKISQLSSLARRAGISCGIYGYGRMALMALRNCPVRAQIGCVSCGQAGYLTDRMGIQFPIRCDKNEGIWDRDNCASFLLNSLPLSMTDKQKELTDFDFVLLDFTIESAEQTDWVLNAWENKLPLKDYTRGLYTRGVMG